MVNELSSLTSNPYELVVGNCARDATLSFTRATRCERFFTSFKVFVVGNYDAETDELVKAQIVSRCGGYFAEIQESEIVFAVDTFTIPVPVPVPVPVSGQ